MKERTKERLKPIVKRVIPARVLGPVYSRWDARRSRVEKVVEARPFDPVVGAQILAGARENLRSTAGAKPPIDAGERWQFFLDRIRGDVEGFQTVRETIAYAQSAVDFDHRGDAAAFEPWAAYSQLLLCGEYPQFEREIHKAADSEWSRPSTQLRIGGKPVSNITHFHLRYALTPSSLKPVSYHSVFEIGGGYGAPARMWKLTVGVDRYAIADFPESLFFAEVFLRANFPDADLLYVREPADPARAAQADFILCPIQHVESLKGVHFDLAVNTGSIQEMTEEWVDFWMDYLDTANVSLFYSLNYFAQPLGFMFESKNTWSPRPHPRWAARLLRAEPYFVKTQTTRVYAETMYEKGDSPDIDAANRAYELYDRRFFDVQCMLEQMDAIRVTRDTGQMWRLLERIMEELAWVPKEAYWLAEQLASNGAAGIDRGRLSGYTKRLSSIRKGGVEGWVSGRPLATD
jgi:putative sugar O-methyltransferase